MPGRGTTDAEAQGARDKVGTGCRVWRAGWGPMIDGHAGKIGLIPRTGNGGVQVCFAEKVTQVAPRTTE